MTVRTPAAALAIFFKNVSTLKDADNFAEEIDKLAEYFSVKLTDPGDEIEMSILNKLYTGYFLPTLEHVEKHGDGG